MPEWNWIGFPRSRTFSKIGTATSSVASQWSGIIFTPRRPRPPSPYSISSTMPGIHGVAQIRP
jgi:hypothetical protein